MLFDDDPGPDPYEDLGGDLPRRREERNRHAPAPADDILEAVGAASETCGSTDPHRVHAQLKFDGAELPVNVVERALAALQRTGRLRR